MKRNLKQYMGVCLLLILSMVSGHTALAANTWKMAAKELTANERTTLSIELANSDTVSAFQFTINIPEKLLLMGNPVLNSARTDGHILSWTPLQGNQYLCVVYSLQNDILKGNTGELLSIPVLVDPSFTGGTVKMTDLLLTNKQAQKLDINAELGALSLKKEKQRIQLIVSGLTQTASTDSARISLTTIPEGITGFTITYSNGDRTQAGVFDVTVTREEDQDYLAVNEKFRMVIEDKRKATIETQTLTASAINAGQRLSQSLLSGGSATYESSPVPGKFVWQNPEQEVTAAGSYTAVFVPTDNSRYTNVEVAIAVTVNTIYNVYLLPQVGGSLKVEGEHADHTYVAGQTLTVTALPDPNYVFKGWNDNSTANPRIITVNQNLNLYPRFERPKYRVNVPQTENGLLTVTCDGISLDPGIHECLKGEVLLVNAVPNKDYILQALTIGGVERTKYQISDNVSIAASFVSKPVDKYTIQASVIGRGSVRLYNTKGDLIVPGSSLEKNSEFIAIVVPEAGNTVKQMNVSGATESNGKYTLTSDAKVEAEFIQEEYTIDNPYGTENESGYISITSTTQTQNEKYHYGDEVIINASDNLDRLVINGKELKDGDTYTIKGPTKVYATFIEREKIDSKCINQDVQSYVFDHHDQSYNVYASGIYSYLGFNVSYPGLINGEQAPVNAGKYNVQITREKDRNYEPFDLTLTKALEVTKAKMRVKSAPTSTTENETLLHGTTEPAYGEVTIEQDASKNYLYKFTYKPSSTDAVNYEEVVYYYSNSDTKYKLSVGNTATLRSTEVPGYVLVTNGNMVVEDLNAIPQGTMLTLQAIANPNYRFMGWKIGGASEISNTENLIKDIPLEGNLTYEPVFEGKAALSASMHSKTVKSGELPAITVTAPENLTAPTDYQVRFFAKADGSQPMDPQDVKNVGTYYVQIYRAEDSQFKEFKSEFMPFTVEKADIPEGWIVPPTATDILLGDTLAESKLIGGSAGLVPGSFAWVNPNMKINTLGNQPATMIFTPTDQNYNSFTISVTINVKGVKTQGGTSDPVTPDTPKEPEKHTVTPPVVTERTPTTAVITWDKVEGATAYKLFLYAKKGDTTPLMTYEFDANGQLKASAISFNLTGLEEGKSYYVKTVAYQGEEVLVEQAIALSATPTAIERIADAVQITTTKGMIHVTLATPLSVRVLSMSGLTLYEQADAVGRLDIPVVNAGVYAVILYKGHEVLLQKVIVR